jgi:parallel beta-helix repeat protein
MMSRDTWLGLYLVGVLAAASTAACSDGDKTPSSTGGSGNEGGSSSEGGAGGAGSTVTLGAELNVVPDSPATGADGSSSHPFPTIYAALDAIAGAPAWDGTIVMHEGTHLLPTEVVLPKNAYLKLLAGTTVASGPGISIHAQRDVTSLGTEEKPVTFTWSEVGSHWGSLTNFEPTSQDNVFEYTIFEHGHEADFNGIGMRGALSLNKAKARVSYCTFRENEGDDGLNMKASSTLVEFSLFENNASDAVDADGVARPEIAHSIMRNNVNDGVDLGEGTTAYVHDNFIYKSGDKGVSNGDGAAATIEHNLIVECSYGIGIKDDADPTIVNNTLYGNVFGLRIYHHVDGFGGGKGRFINGVIWNSTMLDLSFEEGTTVIEHSCIGNLLDADGNDALDGDGNLIADAPGMLTSGAGCDDPLFADPDTFDFHLLSAAGRWDPEAKAWVKDAETSPLIDAGDPTQDVADEPAPNGGRIDIGRYGGTDEASKSP